MNNPQQIAFTPDWLRTFPGCEYYSDEHATTTIESLRTFATLLMNPTHIDPENAAIRKAPTQSSTTIAITSPNTIIHLPSPQRAA